MSDYGTDLSSAEDVDFTREVSGVEIVAQDILWRLQTPAAMGILATDAPEYGLDLAGMVGASLTPSDEASMPGRIQSEILKDERVSSAIAKVISTPNAGTITWDIDIRCTTADGPFDLVFALDSGGVKKATIALLQGSSE